MEKRVYVEPVRRKKQLLSLIFHMSKDASKLGLPTENMIAARSSDKVKFTSDFTSVTRVQNSLVHRGI